MSIVTINLQTVQGTEADYLHKQRKINETVIMHSTMVCSNAFHEGPFQNALHIRISKDHSKMSIVKKNSRLSKELMQICCTNRDRWMGSFHCIP